MMEDLYAENMSITFSAAVFAIVVHLAHWYSEEPSNSLLIHRINQII